MEGTTVTMMPMTRAYARGDLLATMMQRTFAARKCRRVSCERTWLVFRTNDDRITTYDFRHEADEHDGYVDDSNNEDDDDDNDQSSNQQYTAASTIQL